MVDPVDALVDQVLGTLGHIVMDNMTVIVCMIGAYMVIMAMKVITEAIREKWVEDELGIKPSDRRDYNRFSSYSDEEGLRGALARKRMRQIERRY